MRQIVAVSGPAEFGKDFSEERVKFKPKSLSPFKNSLVMDVHISKVKKLTDYPYSDRVMASENLTLYITNLTEQNLNTIMEIVYPLLEQQAIIEREKDKGFIEYLEDFEKYEEWKTKKAEAIKQPPS